MQNSRFSVDKNRSSHQETSSIYARGYEAGKRTSHIDNVQRPIDAQVFRLSEGAVAPISRVLVNARVNQIKKLALPMNREGVTHIDEQQLKNIDHHHHEEHEINGQISSPNTPVQFNRHRHY